ncbi:MAG: hypothetical protein WDO14_07790 [Bacteroidota bacterium]
MRFPLVLSLFILIPTLSYAQREHQWLRSRSNHRREPHRAAIFDQRSATGTASNA